ncbi:hypothetical protein E2C01_051293 [Portunus trituberculatus]|uniref:Uncharacterized protein n=1 Tax=Portunus trituberculatus TaxID=210409 RepID=A0A5B7GIS9_PORTR|nr:hypothetical protein [Portunus trituberculatus]
MFFISPCISFRWHICNLFFLFFISFVLIVIPITSTLSSPYCTTSTDILSRTIISTPPPPLSFLSLLHLLYPSSLKLTWICSLSFVSTMHITSSFFSFK